MIHIILLTLQLMVFASFSIPFDAQTHFAEEPAPLGIRGGWWSEGNNFAERILNARAYNHTFNYTRALLPNLTSSGYSVLNLDWPVKAGPVSLFGGFGAQDYYKVDPNLGSEQDWLDLVDAAHAHGMKVISWFNPSYIWTGSQSFKKAEEDVKRYGIHSLPTDSPARWFRWTSRCNHAPEKPSDINPGNFRSDHWVHDVDAGACYWAVFSDQPSGDYARVEWKEEIIRIFKHWINTGMDGFMLDWPQGYVTPTTADPPSGCPGGDSCDSVTLNDTIIAPLKKQGEIMVMGEGDPFGNTPTSFLRVLDGSINVGLWAHTDSLNHMIDIGDPADLEKILYIADRMQSIGVVPRSGPDVTYKYKGMGKGGAPAILQVIVIATLGGYYTLHSTGGPHVANADYGDFGTWDGEKQAGIVLKAIAVTPALHPGATRRSLIVDVNNGGVYACLRTSRDASEQVVVVFNFARHERQAIVDLTNAGITKPQIPIDIITGIQGSSKVDSDSQLHITLSALNFALLKLKLSPPCAVGDICGALSGPSACIDLSTSGTTDWLHTGSGMRKPGGVGIKLTHGLFTKFDYSLNGLEISNGAGCMTNGIFTRDSFTVNIDVTESCILHAYVGIYQARGNLTVSTSNGIKWTDKSLVTSNDDAVYGHYTLHIPSGKVKLTWSINDRFLDEANVSLEGLALSC